jgi:hypothetical protein
MDVLLHPIGSLAILVVSGFGQEHLQLLRDVSTPFLDFRRTHMFCSYPSLCDQQVDSSHIIAVCKQARWPALVPASGRGGRVSVQEYC